MQDLKRFLDEDVGKGDITTEIFIPDNYGTASILCEEDSVVAGLEEAQGIFKLLNVESKLLTGDGCRVRKGMIVMTLSGPLKGILTGERTALNFLMRMSGIATATASIIEVVRTQDDNIKIAGTRKTTPGFREFEKKAIALGGGWPHRNGLYDMIMIKDNHILACGGIENAMKKAKNAPQGIMIDVEVSNIDDGMIAAKYGADIIMADHMTPADTKMLRDVAKKINPEVLIEASGNITKDNVLDFTNCADMISLGALTHSVKAVHFSLDITNN